jgi:hypothetical protein
VSLEIREAIETDVPFIVETWARHFYQSRASGVLSRDLFLGVHFQHFANTIAREDVTALVAFSPQAEIGSEIYGYLVFERYEPPILHYTYITDVCRRHGVLRALLACADVDLSRRFIATCRHPRLLSFKERREKAGKSFHFTVDPRFLRDPSFKERHREKTRRRAVPRTVETTRRRRARSAEAPRPS